MTLGELIERVRSYSPGGDVEVIQRAYDFSAEVHRGQRRLSGEPYLTHPLQVAAIIADLRLDPASVATALLHDTVEDTIPTPPEIEARFGPEIAALVDGVTKIGQINFTSREEKQAENFRKMLLAMARDIRVILVKLADRTHNMRTLGHLPHERQLEIAQETLEIYAPLAHRLGIYWLKSELEDNALRYLHPEVYYQLKRSVAKKKAERAKYTKEVVSVLSRRPASRRRSPGGRSTSTRSTRRCRRRTCSSTRSTISWPSASWSTRSGSATRRSGSCTRAGSPCPAASRTTSRCRRPTAISPCTRP